MAKVSNMDAACLDSHLEQAMFKIVSKSKRWGVKLSLLILFRHGTSSSNCCCSSSGHLAYLSRQEHNILCAAASASCHALHLSRAQQLMSIELASQASHVKIDEKGVQALAKNLADAGGVKALTGNIGWSSCGWHYAADADIAG
eukprot:13341-Heterococcus_DN1.PRE.2